jgi:predicted DCC family thiol-disulfide oxidoreductase YuxK
MLSMSSTYQTRPGEAPAPGTSRLEVFYDADCGFCTRSARLLRRLDHGRRLQLTPLQLATEATRDAPPLDVLLHAMHVRDGAGRWSVGGAAWLRIAQDVPLLRPLGFLAQLPVIRALVEPTYAVVAGNRHRISRLLGDEACPIAERKP